nr:hypothetical protein [Aquimarina agarivorans]
MSALKKNINYFWNGLAKAILNNRIIVALIIIFATIGLISQWGNIQFSFTETNLLPDDHPVNIEYNKFFEKFGEEGVVIVMAVKDSTIFEKNKFNSWVKLNEKLQTYDEVDFVVSFSEIKELTKTEDPKSFTLTPVSNTKVFTEADIAKYRQKLFNELPFYEGLIYSSSKKNHTICAIHQTRYCKYQNTKRFYTKKT